MLLQILSAVVVALVASGGTYLAVRRRTSGKIETSEAGALWAESNDIRKELREDNAKKDQKILEQNQHIVEQDNRLLKLREEVFELKKVHEECIRQVKKLTEGEPNVIKDLLKRSDQLDKKIAESDIEAGLQALIKYGRRSRFLITLLAISLLVDFLLTFVVIGLGLWTRSNDVKIIQNRASLVATCQASNGLRASEKRLWEYILQLPPSRILTPEEQRRQEQTIAEFRQFLNKEFAPLDCEVKQ